MRWMVGLYCLIFSNVAHGQIVAFVSDTVRVTLRIFPDSTYHLQRDPGDSSYVIYFDAAKTKIATSHTYISKNRYDTKHWYPNGQPKKFELNNDSLPYYQKDYISWFADGHLARQVTTTRDSTIVISWWSNHQLQTVNRSWGAPWDHRYGHHLFWNDKGNLVEQNRIDVDSSITQNYHENGTVSWIRIYHRDTSKWRSLFLYSDQTFHPNGAQRTSLIYPANGRQPITYFYPTGEVQAKCDWFNGNIGTYTEWHKNGKIKSEGIYSVGIIYFPNHNSYNYYPTKTGHWIYYNEAGWIEKEEWRDFDGLVKTKEYNEKGALIREYESQVRIDAKEFPEEYRK